MNLQEEDINFWQIWPDKTGYVFFLFLISFKLSEQKKSVSHDLSKIHIKLLTITCCFFFLFLWKIKLNEGIRIESLLHL